MSRKYSFSIKVGDETLEAAGFDSFDEAIKACEKGVYDRCRVLKEREVLAREDLRALKEAQKPAPTPPDGTNATPHATPATGGLAAEVKK